MANWGEIKKSFIDWLKTQDVGYKDNDKGYAPIKYSEQFKLFIAKYDGDENLNMDNFVRSKEDIQNDRLPKDEDEEGKELTPEEVAEQEKKMLITDMLDDFVSSLSANDLMFKAIDGISGDASDGKISDEEKNMFIDKVMEADFDNDVNNLSFDDIVESVKNIESGNTSFLLQENANVHSSLSDTPLVTEPPVKTKVEEMTSVFSDFDPKALKPDNINISSSGHISSALEGMKIDDSMDIETLNGIKDTINDEIDSAKEDFSSYKDAHAAASDKYNKAKDFNEANNAEYNKILQQILAGNDEITNTNLEIAECENAIITNQDSLNNMSLFKDDLTLAISATDGEISSLSNSKVSLSDFPQGTAEYEQAVQYNANIEARIYELKQEKQRLLDELAQAAQNILELKDTIEKNQEDLDAALDKMAQLTEGVEFANNEQKELFNAVLQNKRVMSQTTSVMNSAKAGMVATDAYIKVLDGKLQETEEAIKLKETAPEETLNTTADETSDTQNQTSDEELYSGTEGMLGLQQPIDGLEPSSMAPSFTGMGNVDMLGAYVVTINDYCKMEVSRQSDGTYKYTMIYEDNPDTADINESQTRTLSVGRNGEVSHTVADDTYNVARYYNEEGDLDRAVLNYKNEQGQDVTITEYPDNSYEIETILDVNSSRIEYFNAEGVLNKIIETSKDPETGAVTTTTKENSITSSATTMPHSDGETYIHSNSYSEPYFENGVEVGIITTSVLYNYSNNQACIETTIDYLDESEPVVERESMLIQDYLQNPAVDPGDIELLPEHLREYYQEYLDTLK